MRAKTCFDIAMPAVLALAFTAHAHAGDLEPPGPPAPTMRTLQEIEPRVPIESLPFAITQPGSYYLTGNLTGISGQSGISISASNVTLDLSGFALIGVPGSGNGVTITGGTQRNVAVRNGTVRNWGSSGILASNAEYSQMQDLRVSDNGLVGVAAGVGSTVQNCTAASNGNTGISVSQRGVILGCTATLNSQHGFSVGPNSTVSNCTAIDNLSNGIAAGSDSTVTGCTAQSNGGAGISHATGGVISHCTVTENQTGIQSGPNTVIVNCTATLNTQTGIVGNSGTTVRESTANFNSTGITIDANGTVIDCITNSNSVDGIRVSSASKVLGNTSNGNGTGPGTGTGIHVTGPSNRIDGNTIVSNDIGIDVDIGGNLIIRNSARANGTNYVDDASLGENSWGPVLTATTIETNGNAHANYAH